MIIGYAGICLAVIFLIFLFFDLFFTLRDWLLRIHIGRFSNLEDWKEKVFIKSVRWAKKTPKVKINDQDRLVLVDMLKGKYTNSTIQSWQLGALITGINEYVLYCKEESINLKVDSIINGLFNESGQWKKKPEYVDSAMLAYAVLKTNRDNGEKYKESYDYIWELIKSHIGTDGTVMYRKPMNSYRYVDTIGLICPFLIAYGVKYKNHDCIDLALKQIESFYRYGISQVSFLPYHAYDIHTKNPLGLNGWGRGMAWFGIGLIDSIKEMPEDHEKYQMLKCMISEFSNIITNYQQSDGSWKWALSRKESLSDNSATAVLAWFLLNSSDLNNQEGRLDIVRSSIRHLMKATRRNGEVDFSQGDTKDIGVYSQSFKPLPFTQGFTLRLIAGYYSYENTHSAKEMYTENAILSKKKIPG